MRSIRFLFKQILYLNSPVLLITLGVVDSIDWLLTLDSRRTSYSAETVTLLIKMFKYRRKGTIIIFSEPLPPKLVKANHKIQKITA